MMPPARCCVEAEVLRNERVSSRYWLMALHAPRIAPCCRPGQFVQLRPLAKAGANGFCAEPLLPRPFAVYGLACTDSRGGESRPDVPDVVEILYLVSGRGTALMAALEPGAPTTILGPLGRAFWIPDQARALVAIGGGTGLAALRFLLEHAQGTDGRVRYLVTGARTADVHLAPEALGEIAAELALATDDGSGADCFHGTCVQLAARIIDGLDGDGIAARDVQVYAAGPVAMMEAAWEMCRARGAACQVSLEAIMACGVGVCRSCVVDVNEADPHTGLRRRAMCIDGPVFDAAELDWVTVRGQGLGTGG